MTGAFIVNRRAAIFRVLLVLVITFTLGFVAGRVSAAPKSAPAVMPAAPSGETSGTLPALSGALHSRLLEAERSVPVILGGGASRVPRETPSAAGRSTVARPAGQVRPLTGDPILRGTASWGWFGGHVVTRYPRGTRIRVCGALGCWSGRSWGYGPAVWTGHIADLDRVVFGKICGSPSRGIAPITLEVWR